MRLTASARAVYQGSPIEDGSKYYVMGFYVLTYCGIAVFILAVVCLVYRQGKLPVHVRWEIYPVQHESAGRIVYGGSYMEELNWWSKKYETSPGNEFKYMVPEILLLRGLRKENKRLWRLSFPFHFGLYLLIGALALLLIQAGCALGGRADFAALSWLTAAVAWTGLILGSIGSLGLLIKRLTDPDLRRYSSLADYFNIVFIFLFFLTALAACLAGDPLLGGARDYLSGLLTGGHAPHSYRPGQTVCGGAAIVLASLLCAYIPLTHMSHMFMKYFLYHRVKWDDVPNLRGGAIEAGILRNLELQPTWQAKHIGADGRKSWRDIAASAPKETK